MSQAFCTTYVENYPWHLTYGDRTKTLKPAETVYAEAPKADIWIAPESASESKKLANTKLEDLQTFVKKLYRSRNWTTYQVCYCKDQIKKTVANTFGEEIVEEIPENELIAQGQYLFNEKKVKILKPLPTSRKLYGYMRANRMYGGLSEYQEQICKPGYDILLKDYLGEKARKKPKEK